MNLDLIGEENLPNVYVESIDINPIYQSGATRKDMGAELEVVFKVFDGLTRRGVPYFSDFRDHPRKMVFVVLSKDPRFTQFLTSRGGKLDPKLLKDMPGYDSEMVEHKLFPAKKVRLKKEKETEIFYKTKMKLPINNDHAVLFACVIKEYDDLYDNGPVTSELIIIDKEPVKKAFYFTEKDTNIIWNGPVHRHTGRGFMGGSFHTNRRHPTLEKIAIPNLKIRDNRIKKDQKPLAVEDRKQPKEKLKNYHFSDLLSSQADNGAFNFIFNIDVFQIMKDYSTNKKLSMTNEDLFYNITSRSRIRDIEIYYNTESNKQFKLMSKSKDINGVLRTAYSDIRNNRVNFIEKREDRLGKIESIIEELILNKEPELKTFNCQINKKKIYQIKVDVTIRDPLREYFLNIKKRTESALSSLKNYHALLRKPMNYDKNRSKTTLVFKERYFNRTDLWYDPIRVFEEMININSKISQKEKNDIIRNMFFMLSPKTLSITSCEKAVRLFSKELERFSRLFDLKKNPSFGKGRTNAKSNIEKNVIKINKIYTVNFKRNPRMLDIMPTSDLDKQIPLLRVSQVFKMLTKEAERYKVDLGDRPSFNDRSRDIFFVGPRVIKFKNNSYDVSNFDKVSEEDIRKIVEESNKKIDIDFFSNNLLVQRYIKKIKNTIDPIKQLGQSSPFQTNLDSKDKKKLRLDIPKNKKLLSGHSRNRKKGFEKNKQLFSPSSKKNIFASKSQQQTNRIPIHLKDLTFKDEVFGVNKEEFLLKEPNKRSLMYENLYKMNILSELKLDKMSRKPLNSRKLQETTEQEIRRIEEPTYCILSKHVENNSIEEDNEFNRFTPANSLFVIIPDNWDFKREVIDDVQVSNELSYLYDQMSSIIEIEESFMRTNLVEQDRDRQLFSSKRPSGVTNRPTRPKNGRTEETKTEQQVKQEQEEVAKNKRVEEKKPIKQKTRPSRKQIIEKIKDKKRSSSPRQQSTPRRQESTPRRQQPVGRRRGY